MAVLACVEILEIAPDAARLAQANADVLHVAIAAVEDVDYLLTWNCRHIANAEILNRLEHRSRALGFKLPAFARAKIGFGGPLRFGRASVEQEQTDYQIQA